EQSVVVEAERRAAEARQERAARRPDPDEIFESIAISEDNLPGEVEVAFNRFLDGLPGDRLVHLWKLGLVGKDATRTKPARSMRFSSRQRVGGEASGVSGSGLLPARTWSTGSVRRW